MRHIFQQQQDWMTVLCWYLGKQFGVRAYSTITSRFEAVSRLKLDAVQPVVEHSQNSTSFRDRQPITLDWLRHLGSCGLPVVCRAGPSTTRLHLETRPMPLSLSGIDRLRSQIILYRSPPKLSRERQTLAVSHSSPIVLV